MAIQQLVDTDDASDRTIAEREVVLVNRSGLHARAAVWLAQLAGEHDAAVVVAKDDQFADGRNPLELVLLDAPAGTALHITATGRDASALVDELAALIECGFGEERSSPQRKDRF